MSELGPRPPRILIVDDEAPIRLLCRVNLESTGMSVIEAAEGRSGVAKARDEHPDLVLLNVMMPGIYSLGSLTVMFPDWIGDDAPSGRQSGGSKREVMNASKKSGTRSPGCPLS